MPAQPAAPSKPVDPARDLAGWWWERQTPRPAGKSAWHSAVAAIRAVLAAGHAPEAVKAALGTLTPPLSVPRLEIALNQRRQSTTAVADWAEGDEFWTTP